MSQLKIKDGNSWINIPAGGIGVPSGGNANDVLVKSSSTDYATGWDSIDNVLETAEVIHELKPVFTQLSPGGGLNAFTGAGATLTPTAPDGYTLLTHVSVWNTGEIGVSVAFDAYDLTTASINVFQFNAANVWRGRGTISLLSLYYR